MIDWLSLSIAAINDKQTNKQTNKRTTKQTITDVRSKRVTASHIDELGLSVLIKSCDRLGDAEWAVMILKEVIKAGKYKHIHIHIYVYIPKHNHFNATIIVTYPLF